MIMVRRPTDSEIVAALLDATRDLTLREIEERVGISTATVTRWRAGEWARLFGSTREQVMGYLESVGAAPEVPEAAPRPLTAEDRARLLALVEEMATILRGE